MAELTIERRVQETLPVVELVGELDAFHAPRLRETFEALIQPGCVAIVVNLSQVSYIDSTGLGTLVAARKWAEEHGGTVRLVVPVGPVHRTLQVTGLMTVFPIFDTESAALAG